MAQEDPGDGFPAALAAKIGFLLAQAHMTAREAADEALAKVGVDARDFGALATIASDGPISQRRLSRRLRMDPATMVDVIDALEQSGYVVRKRNPSDRREYALQLTSRGRSLYERANQAVDRADRRTIGKLDAGDATRLRALLGRIVAR